MSAWFPLIRKNVTIFLMKLSSITNFAWRFYCLQTYLNILKAVSHKRPNSSSPPFKLFLNMCFDFRDFMFSWEEFVLTMARKFHKRIIYINSLTSLSKMPSFRMMCDKFHKLTCYNYQKKKKNPLNRKLM